MSDEMLSQLQMLDDKLQDLLIERACLMGQQDAQLDNCSYQPDRDVETLRHLIERHSGELPIEQLLKIWRDVQSMRLNCANEFRIAVLQPSKEESLWDISRDHFGSFVTLQPTQTAQAALRALAEDGATVCVLPMPEDGESDPWWRHLMGPEDSTPRIVARLPFIGKTNAQGGQEALIVGHVASNPSKQDRTYIGLELGQDISRSRLKDCLEKAELPVQNLFTWRSAIDGQPLHLLELEGGVAQSDARLVKLEQALGETEVTRLFRLGGVALPHVPATQQAASPQLNHQEHSEAKPKRMAFERDRAVEASPAQPVTSPERLDQADSDS